MTGSPGPSARPCTHCGGTGWCLWDAAVPCEECNGTGARHIRAGHVVRGDVVYLPGRGGAPATPVLVVEATRGYRDADRGQPDHQRQKRRLVGVNPLSPPRQRHLSERAWVRPFGERLRVARLITDRPDES